MPAAAKSDFLLLICFGSFWGFGSPFNDHEKHFAFLTRRLAVTIDQSSCFSCMTRPQASHISTNPCDPGCDTDSHSGYFYDQSCKKTQSLIVEFQLSAKAHHLAHGIFVLDFLVPLMLRGTQAFDMTNSLVAYSHLQPLIWLKLH